MTCVNQRGFPSADTSGIPIISFSSQCWGIKAIDRIQSIALILPVYRESFCCAVFLGEKFGNTSLILYGVPFLGPHQCLESFSLAAYSCPSLQGSPLKFSNSCKRRWLPLVQYYCLSSKFYYLYIIEIHINFCSTNRYMCV